MVSLAYQYVSKFWTKKGGMESFCFLPKEIRIKEVTQKYLPKTPQIGHFQFGKDLCPKQNEGSKFCAYKESILFFLLPIISNRPQTHQLDCPFCRLKLETESKPVEQQVEQCIRAILSLSNKTKEDEQKREPEA